MTKSLFRLWKINLFTSFKKNGGNGGLKTKMVVVKVVEVTLIFVQVKFSREKFILSKIYNVSLLFIRTNHNIIKFFIKY